MHEWLPLAMRINLVPLRRKETPDSRCEVKGERGVVEGKYTEISGERSEEFHLFLFGLSPSPSLLGLSPGRIRTIRNKASGRDRSDRQSVPASY